QPRRCWSPPPVSRNRDGRYRPPSTHRTTARSRKKTSSSAVSPVMPMCDTRANRERVRPPHLETDRRGRETPFDVRYDLARLVGILHDARDIDKEHRNANLYHPRIGQAPRRTRANREHKTGGHGVPASARIATALKIGARPHYSASSARFQFAMFQ